MKHIIAICLVLAMLFTLWGCGKSTPKENAASESAAEPTLVPTTIPIELEPFNFATENYTIHLPIYEMVRGTVLGEPYYDYSDFRYNEKGQLVSKFDRAMDETLLYEYDEQGHLTAAITLDEDGGETTEHFTYYDTQYTYDDTRHHMGHLYNFGLIKHCYRTSDYEAYEGVTWDYQYEFNEQGLVSKRTCAFSFPTFDANGRDYQAYSKDTTVYEYNADGLISRETNVDYFEGKKSEYEYNYTYDSAGRLIQVDSMLFPSYDDYPSYYTDTFEYDVVATREISTQTNPELLTSDQWEGFTEQFDLPMPDTCVDTIEYVGREENTAAVVYTYKLPDGQQAANEEYYKFQQILAEVCGFTCENRNDMVYINDDTELLSLMMAGKDPELGYFLQISFSNSMSAKN